MQSSLYQPEVEGLRHFPKLPYTRLRGGALLPDVLSHNSVFHLFLTHLSVSYTIPLFCRLL